MPRGTSRFMGSVVSMAVLMPLAGASAQEPETRSAANVLAIVESEGGFVIRPVADRRVSPRMLRLGNSVRLDRALLAPPSASNLKANEGVTGETR